MPPHSTEYSEILRYSKTGQMDRGSCRVYWDGVETISSYAKSASQETAKRCKLNKNTDQPIETIIMRASIFVISVFTVGNLFVHHSFILSLKIPNPSTSTIFNRRWLSKRDEAIPTSPSGGYAPSRQPCPTSLQVRQPSVEGPLNANELEYVNQKSSKSIPLWKDYLSNVGGGARAGLVGAGVLNGFDGRNPEAQRMKTGGLLQLANYAAGLSGGSWLLGSWATSNFPRFTSLNQTVWKLTEPDAIYDLHILKQIDRDLQTATEKAKAGFETSIVENTTNNANAVLLSSVRNLTGYATHYAPFIIVTATSRAEGKGDMTLDNPVYEFTPEEFGTWHPSLNAFIPVEFLGTKINQGQLSRGDQCVVGFDSMGATSSNVFSLSSKTDGQPFFIALAHKFLNALAQNVFDESIIPNPFRGLGLGYGLDNGYPARDDENLYLADSSLSGETLPLWPLIQPSRNLECHHSHLLFSENFLTIEQNRAKPSLNILHILMAQVFMRHTRRTLGPDYEAYSFPQVPDPYEGEFSDGDTINDPSRTDAPTAQMQFRVRILLIKDQKSIRYDAQFLISIQQHTELDGYFSNGFAIATQSKDSSDELSDTLEDNLDRTGVSDPIEWSACLACALIDRHINEMV
ncbi:lysophospholipase catalytic domain-containing protein [Melampsora americana]|nr:lysophospholipase catalytic domain-containing protein [Melampsora americana]